MPQTETASVKTETMIDVSWAPGPTWLLRRDRILRCLRKLPRGRILEVGCGAGGMLTEFSRAGFQCCALETSAPAAQAARQRTVHFDNVVVQEKANDDWEESFDFVVAFEVLEHIEFDSDALKQWMKWLKPGGHFLMSVPAHMKRWNASDQWAGHFRRYERKELKELIESMGLKVQRLDCYGFPLSNLAQPIRAKIHSRQLEPNSDSHEKRQFGTARSGVDRQGVKKYDGLIKSIPGRLAVSMFCQVQRMFVGTELGNNFFLHGVKTESEQFN